MLKELHERFKKLEEKYSGFTFKIQFNNTNLQLIEKDLEIMILVFDLETLNIEAKYKRLLRVEYFERSNFSDSEMLDMIFFEFERHWFLTKTSKEKEPENDRFNHL